MFKLVAAQFCLLSILVLATYVFGGSRYAVSLFWGGFSYAWPTFLSTLALKCFPSRTDWLWPMFFGGTVLKIVLMTTVFIVYPNVHFISFLIGFVAVSHLVFLIFLKVYRYGR